MKKRGRNDKCDCNSGLKYKKCCFEKNQENKYTLGQEISSPKILDVINKLNTRFSGYRIINITDDLDIDNYKKYQITNYNTNIIMVAEKNFKNSLVFLERQESELTDIIVMYRGAYRSFIYETLDNILNSLSLMIK